MVRELVSRERLLEILNEELAKHDECEDAKIAGPIYIYREPDDKGCNWSPQVTVRGHSVDVCKRVADQVVASARQRYNLNE